MLAIPFRLKFLRASAASAALAVAASSTLAGGQHASGHHNPAIGEPGQATKVTRTVQIEASDSMRFTPANLTVQRGETIRFVIRNTGQLPHEFSLGTQKDLLDHYEVMKKFPGMEHDEPNQISLKPGEQGEVIWRFTRAGTVHFACLHVGHYDAGMKGQVRVTTR